MRAGVIGLGTMKSGFATDLIANGFEAARPDLSEVHTAGFRDIGSTPAGSVAEVAARSDAVPAMVMNRDPANSEILGIAGSGIGTKRKNRMISLDLAEELEVPMQMASAETQKFHVGQSRSPQGDEPACARLTEEVVRAESHREGAQ
ncbi:MAG: NAD(P)-binding domain-containing protein [Boseongicola sp.]|nr:NAD(P)-binding domain-containing protein [Boseongicola sp.]